MSAKIRCLVCCWKLNLIATDTGICFLISARATLRVLLRVVVNGPLFTNHRSTGYKYNFAETLPEFLNGGLLLPCENNVSGVVDGEKEDVPVTTEPGDEKGTGEGLEGPLNHLSGTHPGGGDAQHHQQTTQHLQSRVGKCLIGVALSAGLTAWRLCMRLRAVLSWRETEKKRK